MSKLLLAKDAAEKALAIELSRTGSLLRSAGMFAAGNVVALGVQLRDLKALVESPSPLVKLLCCLSLAVLGASLLLACHGVQARGYGQYPRGQKLWESLKPEGVSADAAEEAVVQMRLQTREQNARLNDGRTRLLGWCAWLFATGSLLVAGSQLLDAFESWT
jgi:hypothetical protein